MLTEMYEDPLLAMVREYATNGIDANIEEGVDEPIEVSLPGEFDPNLVISDKGVGMSMDTIEEVFCKYTASTKRESNDVAGMYGIGSKSALAYTDQFIVETVHDGTKITAFITRGLNEETNQEEIAFEIPHDAIIETDEPNGTSVKIPIKQEDVKILYHKAREYYRLLDPGLILVDGEDLSAEREDMGDNMYLVSPYDHGNNKRGNFYVLMGNVAYKVDTSKYNTSNFTYGHSGKYYHDTLFIAEMGQFKPTTSRESLDISAEDFAKKMDAIRAKSYVSYIKKAQKAFDDAEYLTDPLYNDEKWEIVKQGMDNAASRRFRDEEYEKASRKLNATIQKVEQLTYSGNGSYNYSYQNGTSKCSKWNTRIFNRYRQPGGLAFVTGAPDYADINKSASQKISNRCRYGLHGRSSRDDITIFLPGDDAEVPKKYKEHVDPDNYKVCSWDDFEELPSSRPSSGSAKQPQNGQAPQRVQRFKADEWQLVHQVDTYGYDKKWKVTGLEAKIPANEFDFDKWNLIVATKQDLGYEVDSYLKNFKTEEDKLLLRRADQVDKVTEAFPEAKLFKDEYTKVLNEKRKKVLEQLTDHDLINFGHNKPYRAICYYYHDFKALVRECKELHIFKELHGKYPEAFVDPDPDRNVSGMEIRQAIKENEELQNKREEMVKYFKKKCTELEDYYPIISIAQDYRHRGNQQQNDALLKTLRLIDKGHQNDEDK